MCILNIWTSWTSPGWIRNTFKKHIFLLVAISISASYLCFKNIHLNRVYCCSHWLWGFCVLVCVWSLFCYSVLSVLSSFAVQRAGRFTWRHRSVILNFFWHLPSLNRVLSVSIIKKIFHDIWYYMFHKQVVGEHEQKKYTIIREIQQEESHN